MPRAVPSVRRLPEVCWCLWTPPAIVGAGYPCWQASGLGVGSRQRLLGQGGREQLGSSRAATGCKPCPPPRSHPSRLRSPLQPLGPWCSSCSLVSDLLRVQTWCPLSSDWGQGRLVGPVLVPPWPWGQPGTHRFHGHRTAPGPGLLPLHLLPGGKSLIRPGRQRCGAKVQPLGQGPVGSLLHGAKPAWSPAPHQSQARDGHTCDRLCTVSTARGTGQGTLGPRRQEGLRAPVAPSFKATGKPGGKKTWLLGAERLGTYLAASLLHLKLLGSPLPLGCSDSAHRKPQGSTAPPSYRSMAVQALAATFPPLEGAPTDV